MRRRLRRAMFLKKWWVLVLLVLCCLVFPLLLLDNLEQGADRHDYHPPNCPSPITLSSHAFCSQACDGYEPTCFPRITGGICISASEVRSCAADSFSLPRMMRFHGERLTLPIRKGKCAGNRGTWIKGFSMVADERFLPYKKPNPHHEAEKLIPASLLLKLLGNSTALYWFASPGDVSEWGKGFLQAMSMVDRVKYVELAKEPICFEDAVLFSPPTNVRYVPNSEYNSWLRERVLQHCSLPIVNASTELKSALILDRTGSRHLGNKHEIARVVNKALNIPVKSDYAGNGSFCDQVSKVATQEFMLVPHGSQNVNLLFAPPGARVIEVFPYLFYNDALRNYTHAAQLQVYKLLGDVPPHNLLLRLLSLLGWDLCYHVRWCKNYARRQPVYANLRKLQRLLKHM